MATYFHGAPEIQPDGLQTLFLMNPGYAGYSADTPAPTNMAYLNSAANLQLQHHFAGIPLKESVQDASRPPAGYDMPPPTVHGLLSRLQYNQWNPTATSNSIHLTSVSPPAPQGLSLSLSAQQPGYDLYRPETKIHATAPPVMSPGSGNTTRLSGDGSAAAAVNGVLTGSKYLEAAQQLLEEVAGFGKGIEVEQRKANKLGKVKEEGADGAADVEEAGSKHGATDLSTSERQELHMKKTKLVNMLDEVEQRYREYSQQMKTVIASFEAVAGQGSARTYTSLALKTISKQFRCLRDAIAGQIRATSKSLGEEDSAEGSKAGDGFSRLRLIDQQVRQQRALQQLGMVHSNGWRPQRGLPERAVSVLRAWLFEHFLHPYPKDSDKQMLAKQTGLTRNQVSNWFINARVRLWKPMVEEMYQEENKRQEQERNNTDGKTSKSDGFEEDEDENSVSKSSIPHINSSTIRTEQDHQNSDASLPTNTQNQTSCYYNDIEEMDRPESKKIRCNELPSENVVTNPMPMDMELRLDEANNKAFFMNFGVGGRRDSEEHGYPSLTGGVNNGSGFGAYPIGEFGRFSGNDVSLTLGLPPDESFSLAGTQPSYLPTGSIPMGIRLEMGTHEANANAYWC